MYLNREVFEGEKEMGFVGMEMWSMKGEQIVCAGMGEGNYAVCVWILSAGCVCFVELHLLCHVEV